MRCIRPARLRSILIPILALGFVVLPALSSAAGPIRSAAGPVRGDPARTAALAQTESDSAYAAAHPRLLFTTDEIPALYAKVRDGGADDAAYYFIRVLIQYIYSGSTNAQLLYDNFALNTIPNFGVGSVLQNPPDLAAREKGRNLTLYIADQYECDGENFESALRLRALALGYDMFFAESTEQERATIRSEILSYVDMMTLSDEYEIWSFRPYLANISAMIAASLGLAAICLDGEVDAAVVQTALERADHLIGEWLRYQLDEDGAYNEGATYGSWCMVHLVYYFWARLRYDGTDFSENGKIRNMERWFAYELLPGGGAAVNNIQDCSMLARPMAEHTTYFDWAKAMWNSSLSAYIWEHVAGAYGHNAGADADKAGTVIWHRDILPALPSFTLPPSMLWPKRGLYYFRTGWPSGATSADVLFSFYSGRFEGGHAQEDQNQFTLYAYGAPFAIDHGPGSTAKQSEAHNMVFIDGAGQHNAGSSIGTDGEITRYLLNDYADHMVGDASRAYATYSPVNNIAFPFPTSDWSWGYDGGNPVERADRKFFVVRDPDTPPYFILIDDIEKDGLAHEYEWRLHTRSNNTIDASTNPIRIASGGATLSLHVIHPLFSSLEKNVSYFNNLTEDPDANVLSLVADTADPFFVFVMAPGNGVVATPTVTGVQQPWGISVTVAWPNGWNDVLLVNRTGEPLMTAASGPLLETDAEIALVRVSPAGVERFVLADVSTFSEDGAPRLTIANGRATVGLSAGAVDIDRYDADFSIYAPGVSEVFYRGQRLPVVENQGYLTRDPVTGIPGEGAPPLGLRLRAHPNPFNPSTTLSFELEEAGHVTAVLYDTAGRRVRALWNGPLPAGLRTLAWDGKDDEGAPLSSGVYFARVESGRRTAAIKIVLIR